VSGSHARQELQHTKSRDIVPGVLGPAQNANQILHMRRLQKLEAAVFHERDVALAELDFEEIGVVGRAHQDGHVVQGDAGFALLQHPFHYIVRLRLLILRGHEQWPLLRPSLREQVLFEPLTPSTYHSVRSVQNRLYRAVVLLELDDRGGWVEVAGKIEDVTNRGAAERIDRLGVIADDGYGSMILPQRQDDLGLQRVGVLVLVHQHVSKPPANAFAIPFHEIEPIEQQIVVIEDVAALLRLDVALEQLFQLIGPVDIRRKGVFERRVDGAARVDDVRVDRKAGVLLGKARRELREAEVVAHDVEEIGGVGAIEDREVWIQAHRVRVKPQQSVCNRVKRPRPRHARLLSDDALRAPSHDLCCATSECQEKNAARIGAVLYEV